MVKVFVLGKDNVGWSIDKDRENVISFLNMNDNVKIVDNIFKADIIYCVWYNILLSKKYNLFIRLLKRLLNVKIIANVTNDIIDRGILYYNVNNINYHKLEELVDIWIAPSKKIYNYIDACENKVYLIPFYVDPTEFKKVELDEEHICGFLDIDYEKDIKGKYLIGSFQRDSEGKNLLKPKWQKNPGRLLEILDELPKDKFLLILAGPRRHWIKEQCKKMNIPYLFIGKETSEDDIYINNLGSKEINLLYNLIDLYLVTSDSEGGPKAILEASLSKTLIYSTDVGFAKDMIHEDLMIVDDSQKTIDIIENNIRMLCKNKKYIKYIIYTIYNKMFDNYIKYNHDKVLKKMDCFIMMKKYKEVIDNVDK